VTAFVVLHVCLGNICRSPMSERLLTAQLRRATHVGVADYLSHSAGIGSWHVGESMQPGAARQVRQRGGDPANFRARLLTSQHVRMSDLILTATGEQLSRVLELEPQAVSRAFVLGEFGRLLRLADRPPAAGGPNDVGVALVAAVDQARLDRDGTRPPPRRHDDLPDPYGMSDDAFAAVADEIEATIEPLAMALVSSSATN
jgi:protein-tyrosine phosphatase